MGGLQGFVAPATGGSWAKHGWQQRVKSAPGVWRCPLELLNNETDSKTGRAITAAQEQSVTREGADAGEAWGY